MVTPAEIREVMLCLTGDFLGEYLFEGGQRVPAIAVGHQPNDAIFEGDLEVIIPNTPILVRQVLNSVSSHREDDWRIIIINRGRNTSALWSVYEEATRRLRKWKANFFPRQQTASSYDFMELVIHTHDAYPRV